jgi:hypothetical protein
MNKMKTYLFLFLMISPLWACSSCQDDEDKLPGTKPEILLGKWRGEYVVNSFLVPIRSIIETYEFTSGGGYIKKVNYYHGEDRYEDYHTHYFTDWSYDGHTLHFIYKKGGYRNPWSYDVSELTPDYFVLDTGVATTYYKVAD